MLYFYLTLSRRQHLNIHIKTYKNMILDLVAKNRLLHIRQADNIEYEQLKLLSTISGTDYKGRKAIPWTKTYIENSAFLPAGFWHKIAKLRQTNWNVQLPNITNIVDSSVTVESVDEWIDNLTFKKSYIEPRWYQRKAVFLSQKYAISRGDFATGAGKTLICYLVARYILEKKLAQKGKKVLMVVPSVQLVSQTMSDWYNDYQTDDYIKLDIISGSFPELRHPDGNVILGNIDSLKEFPKSFFKDVGAIIYDEAHKLTTSTYKQVFANCIQNDLDMIYSVSGSWYDANTKGDYECEAISGPLLISVPASQLMAEGSLTPAKIFEVPLHHQYEVCERYYNHEDCQVTEFKNIRNHFELGFIRSQRTRFEAIMAVVEKLEHNQLMLFKSVDYAKQFVAAIKATMPHKQPYLIAGEVSTADRDRIKAITETNDNVIICATYGTMSTGVSINNLFGLHFIEPPKSFIWVRQSIGRTLRLHSSKTYAMIFSYVDIFKKYNYDWGGPQKNIVSKHLKARIKIYEQQNFEFKVLEPIIL